MDRIRKLDRYVAKTFLGPFLLCLFAFVGLYVVVDFFGDIDKFLAEGSILMALRLTVTYYLLNTPSYIAQIMPVLVVIPSVICVLRLDRANEICAMRSSGISGRRIAGSVLGCAGVLAVLAFLNQEILVPSLHDPLIVAERGFRDRDAGPVQFAYMIDQDGRHLLISSFEREAPLPTLTDVRITWEDKVGVHHERKARRAFALELGPEWFMENIQQYDGRTDFFRRKVWEKLEPQKFTSQATYEQIRRYREAEEKAVPLVAPEQGAEPALYEFGSYTESTEYWPVARDIEVIYPSKPEKGRLRIARLVWADDRWFAFGVWRFGLIDPVTHQLQEEQIPDGTPIQSSIRPADIRGGGFKQASALMTLSELADVASRFKNAKFRQRCWVTIWNRLAFPLANLFLVMLTLPFVFRQTRQSALVGVSVAILLTMVYLFANFISIDIAYRYPWFPPVLGGTSPSIVFAAIGVYLFLRIDEV